MGVAASLITQPLLQAGNNALQCRAELRYDKPKHCQNNLYFYDARPA
jgi:hypothetical protein